MIWKTQVKKKEKKKKSRIKPIHTFGLTQASIITDFFKNTTGGCLCHPHLIADTQGALPKYIWTNVRWYRALTKMVDTEKASNSTIIHYSVRYF
jgi:hypothetical protein